MVWPFTWTVVNLILFIVANTFMMGFTAYMMFIMLRRDTDYYPGIFFACLVWPVTFSVLLGILVVKSMTSIGDVINTIREKMKKMSEALAKEKEARRKKLAETPPDNLNPIL